MSEYIDGFRSSHASSLDTRCNDFNFDAVFEHLDGDVPNEERDWVSMGVTVKRLLAALIGSEVGPESHQAIARRTILLAWLSDPGLIHGAPSLNALARQLHCSRGTLASIAKSCRLDMMALCPQKTTKESFIFTRK